jgi:gliding motility-associated-like protein
VPKHPCTLTKKTILTLFCLFASVLLYAQGPAASFTAAVTSGCSPLVVNFQDQSSGNPTAWFWDFGNGATSTLQNPSTTYFNTGVYTVRLTVSNAQGTNTITRTEYITIWGKPQVAFRVSDSVGCFPLRAQFTDLSSAAAGTVNTGWLWDFGNGSQATTQNPLQVYTAAGNYSVTLRVTNDKGCAAVATKPNYIRISDGVTSGFTNTTPTNCRPPFPVTFTNTSSGPGTLSYSWDFGDGNTSTQASPSHTYTTTGNYTVTLTTTSSNGCTDTLRRVNAFVFPQVTTSFAAPDSICINQPLFLQNTSVPAPVTASWDFGDGNTSGLINPVKVYAAPGLYTIRLNNSYAACTDSVSRTIRVLPKPTAAFTGDRLFRCGPDLTVNFQNTSAGAVSWQWSFGDGGTSTLQNPSHTYTSYGTFDVQLIATNATGCSDTLRRTAYVNIIRPVISFPGLPQQGCIPYGVNFTSSIVTQDVVTSYLWNFGDGNTSTAATPSHTYTAQGTYNVTLTITTATGCTETYTLPGAIRVGRRPVINFSVRPDTACAFQEVQFNDLTNEADEWLWLFGDGTSSSQQNPLHQYSDTGLFSVTLIATNNGCRDSLRRNNVIRIKPPIARFGFVTNCTNRLQFAFRDSSIGATTWLWNFGDGTTSTQQNPLHVFPSLGTYTVTLTVTNDTCSHTFSQPIRVVREIPDFTVSQRVACQRSTLNFNAIVPNPANVVEYDWTFGDGNGWNSNVFNAGGFAYNYYVRPGIYTVTLITTDIYGCRDSITKPAHITINGPTASFSAANTNGCRGLTASFTNASVSDGRNAIVSWRWDFGDGTIRTMNTGVPMQHTYNLAGSYTVKLIVTDATGCQDSLVLPNLVNATDPVAAFTVDTLSCPGRDLTFINQSTGINLTYAWDLGDGTTTAVASPTHNYPQPGRYSIQLIVRDQFGCSDTLNRPNYIRIDRPIASFTVSDSISSCIPLEVQFTNTSTYWNHVIWNLNGGISFAANPIQYYVTPGVYPISLIAIAPGGCQDTAYASITILDTAGTSVRYTPLNGCKPLDVELIASSNGSFTYTWDFGDGTLLNNTTDTLRHVYNFFGNFVPKIIMTDPSGCIIPVVGPDTIRIIGTTAKFGLDRRLFCDSGWVNFIDSTTFNDSLVSYTWNFGDGNTSNLQNPSHQYTSPGIYTVSLNVQTVNNCVDTFALNNVIKVVQSPLIDVGGDSVICVNEFMRHLGVFQRTDTSAVQWQWQFPNGQRADIQNPALQQYTSAGNFVVNAIAINSSGCRDTAIQNILVNPLPVITMPPSIVKQTGVPVTIPATYSPNVATYSWTPFATLSCADCPQPITNTRFNATYSVSVVDSNGCRNRREIQVIVTCPNANVFLPNTFSPNNDGSNDIFYVRGRGLERVKSLRIYNRWGELVHEQLNFPVNNPAFGWNGMFKGKKALPDVYVYQVEVLCENAELIRFEGNVALIQ